MFLILKVSGNGKEATINSDRIVYTIPADDPRRTRIVLTDGHELVVDKTKAEIDRVLTGNRTIEYLTKVE